MISITTETFNLGANKEKQLNFEHKLLMPEKRLMYKSSKSVKQFSVAHK